MAVTMTPLTSGNSGTDATSYATASVSPGGDELILLAVLSSHASGANAPSVTGNGLTWVQVATAPLDESGDGSFFRRLTLFRAMGASPTAGAITIDFGAQTQLRCLWSVASFGSVDTSGTNGSGAVVQAVTNDNNGSVTSSWSITLAAFESAANATFGAIGIETRNTITPGGGFTEIHEQVGPSGESAGLQTQWRADNDTTVDWTIISSRPAAIAVEIRAASGAINVGLAPVAVEVVLPAWTVAQGILLAGTPVVAEVVLPAWTVAQGIPIAGTPVAVEVVLPAWTITGLGIEIDLVPVVVEVVLPAWTVTQGFFVDLAAVVVEVVLPAWTKSRGITLAPVVVEVVLPDWTIAKYRPEVAGATAMFIQQADGSEVDGLPGPVLEVAAWETHRYLNRVGNWTAAISASQHPVDGSPLALRIQRGWRISLIQENNFPLFREDLEYLLYRGIVEDKEYSADESGQALCRLSGSFRALELVQRSTPTSAAYEAATLAAAATDIVGGMAGGITYPSNASTETVTLRFNQDGDGVQSRFARLVKLGNYARYALRETWELDALEFVQIDNPPDSGYVLVNQEMGGEGQEYAGAAGFALIGGSPLEVKREGRGIINRIIPFGATERITYIDPASITNPPTLTMAVQPTNGRLLNINGRAIIFTTGTPINGYVPIGATVADTRQSLIDALAADDGINTSPHPEVRLGAFTGDTAEFEFLGVPVSGFFVGGSYLNDAGNTWAEGEASEIAENVPLTLEHATATGPYTVYEGANPDGSAYWYVEDAASQVRHGLIESALHRSDVVNPSDDAGTRAASANVLYAIAAGTLIRQAAAKVYVTVPIANGAQVWALPGDKIKLQYSGNVELSEGVVTWEEFDKWFLVVERHDKADPSGVRQVSLVLAAPEIEMTIPDLPGAVILPITRGPEDSITTLLNELGLGDDTDLGGDGLGGETAPDCCDDPLEEIEDGPAAPEDIAFEDELPCYANPDFETDTSEWFTDDSETPDGIIFFGNGSANISLTRYTGDAHSGVASGRLVQSSTEGYSTGCGQNVGCGPLVAGVTYEVSLWYRGNATGLRMMVGNPGSIGSPAATQVALANASDWTEVTAQFTPGGGGGGTVGKGQVVVCSGPFGGITWDILIDDVTIVAV